MAETHTTVTENAREIRALQSATLSGDTVPRRILLAPWGQVESTHGSFIVDEEAAQSVVDAFAEHGTDLPIDYEHQTLGGTYSSPSGQAPAAGWVKKIHSEPGVGLLADIEWTRQAMEMLASKQYRYLSPVAIINKANRKLVAIHSAALTNKPAIVGMEPIVNRNDLLALGVDATPVTLLQAELGLPSETPTEDVLVAAGRKLADLRQEGQRHHVEERIREAMRAGKLVEAQRRWAEELVAREEQLFDEWLRTTPVVVRPGVLSPPWRQDSVEQRHHCVAMRARAEFRANPLLSRLTTEEAYIADAQNDHQQN